MTGKADHPSTGRTGRTDGRPTPAGARGVRHSQAVPLPIGIDPSAPTPDPPSGETRVAVGAPLPPDVLPRLIRTQALYRQLVASGLTSAEAAGVIGYISGLPTGTSPWTMIQINRQLFLRSLYTESE